MLSSMPVSAEWLSKFAEEHPALQRKHTQIMLERRLAEALRVANGAFGETEDNFSHYRFEVGTSALRRHRPSHRRRHLSSAT